MWLVTGRCTTVIPSIGVVPYCRCNITVMVVLLYHHGIIVWKDGFKTRIEGTV